MVRNVRLFCSLSLRDIRRLFEQTFAEWSRNNASRLGAALAYYTIFSLAPLLIVVIGVAGLVFGPAAARGQIVWQLEDLVGREASQAIQIMLKAAWAPAEGIAATLASLLTLFLGASLVVAELRSSLNAIWEVPAEQSAQGLIPGLLQMVKQRLFAFTLVLGIGFLLLVSLVANIVLAVIGKYFQALLPMPEYSLQILNFLAWFAATVSVFALIYKVLPDVKIAWGDVIVGAIITSLLFTAGKLLIALYLGKSSLASAYGAAGSLVLLLAWVYYSAQIFFFGAQFTKVYANTCGSHFQARRRRWR